MRIGFNKLLRSHWDRWRIPFRSGLDTPLARRRAWLDLLALDHGILREMYPNRHRIADGVYRSSQPSPHMIHALAAQGIRTIVNLRGDSERGHFALETEACAREGIALVNFRLSSVRLPTRAQILDLAALFRSVQRPLLIHCKSGADRAGMASALYLMLVEKAPPDVARRQLGLRYLHVRQFRTGVLDRLFDAYCADTARAPVDFEEWVRMRYDHAVIERAFRSDRAIGWPKRPSALH